MGASQSQRMPRKSHPLVVTSTLAEFDRDLLLYCPCSQWHGALTCVPRVWWHVLPHLLLSHLEISPFSKKFVRTSPSSIGNPDHFVGVASTMTKTISFSRCLFTTCNFRCCNVIVGYLEDPLAGFGNCQGGRHPPFYFPILLCIRGEECSLRF